MTPNARAVYNYVKDEWGRKIGVTNCRKISGSQTWSQHSWSNALDIYVSDRKLGDRIKADLLDKFGEHIRYLLWWREDHYGHIHVDFWPRGWLTPPCAGGRLRVKHKDGTVGYEFTSDIEEVDVAAVQVVDLQVALNEAGQLGANGKVLAEDDIWGPNTAFALANGLRALEGQGVSEETVIGLIQGTSLVPDGTVE